MLNLFTHLTERRLRNAGPGRHSAGRGLWLCCSADGAAHWELHLTLQGEGRDLHLGNYPKLSLKEARKEAAQWRGLARSGLDPSAEQEGFRNAAARNLHQFYC